jgi:hypothetical protein
MLIKRTSESPLLGTETLHRHPKENLSEITAFTCSIEDTIKMVSPKIQ